MSLFFHQGFISIQSINVHLDSVLALFLLALELETLLQQGGHLLLADVSLPREVINIEAKSQETLVISCHGNKMH